MYIQDFSLLNEQYIFVFIGLHAPRARRPLRRAGVIAAAPSKAPQQLQLIPPRNV